MPLTTKSIAKRLTNQSQRHARRHEIEARWSHRCSIRWFESYVLANDEATPADLIHHILEEARWAPIDKLVDYLDPRWRRDVLVKALRIIELKEMPYDQYLQTPEWTDKAEKIKAAWKGRCALDTSHPGDDAHHRTYERRGREPLSDLIPLCRDCHSKHHGKR